MDAATISTLASGTVAVAAISAGILQHRSSLRFDEKESVRVVLDEAAVALHETEYALNNVRFTLTQYGRAFFETEERSKPYRDLDVAGKQLDRLLERLKIRLGRDHDAVESFSAAGEAALEIYRAIQLIKLEPEAMPGDENTERRIAEFVKEQRDRTIAEREKFDSKRGEFIDAAQQTAGADLPRRRFFWR
jgi:hypothetical protein